MELVMLGPRPQYQRSRSLEAEKILRRVIFLSVVCADAVVVLGRTSHPERTVLGGYVGLAAACPESVAARYAGHLLRVLSVVCQRRAGLLRLPIR